VIPRKLVIHEMALTQRIGAWRNLEGVASQANIKKRASDTIFPYVASARQSEQGVSPILY